MSFEAALAAHPAPRALGDVSLRYEPSMLIGETAKGKAGWPSSAAWVAGLSALLFALGALVLALDTAWVVLLLALGAAGMTAAVRLERHEKRQRRFVANFATISLRLDFSTPFAGRPRTLVVPFDDVQAVSLLPQVDGAECLCVDFAYRGAVLREALVAHIGPTQHEEAARFARVLEGAFGLGARPPDSPLGPEGALGSDEPQAGSADH